MGEIKMRRRIHPLVQLLAGALAGALLFFTLFDGGLNTSARCLPSQPLCPVAVIVERVVYQWQMRP
jgi:hypothetical protein